MDMDSPKSAGYYGTAPSYPSTNGQPDFNSYNSHNNSNAIYNGDSMYCPPQAPPAPPLQAPPTFRPAATPPPPGGVMPDAVLNMAAKGGPGKTPFSYVPDADMLKEHRDRVRRRKPSGPDITQSAVYKLIHGLDEPPADPRPQPRRPAPEGHRQVVRQPSQDDELSFSGVGRDPGFDHIPSKAFHKLQSLTGGGEVDRSSLRGNAPPAGPRRRSLRRAESAPHRQEEEEYEDRGGGVDLAYVGAYIPSRSFRMLQRSVGADPNDYDSGVQNGMEDPLMVGPSDGTQPSTEDQTRAQSMSRRVSISPIPHSCDYPAARERRRRRRRGSASLPRQVSSSPVRRPVLPVTQPHETQPSNFDEDAYLAGRVPVVRTEDEIQARPVVGRTRVVKPEIDDEIPPENLRSFDEQAFLAGQVSILGDPDSQTNLPPRAPKKKEFSVKPEWASTVARKKKARAFERSTSQLGIERQREQEKAAMQYINLEDTPKRDFDEKAFLSGQIGIFDDKPKAPRPIAYENKTGNKEPYEFQRIAQRRASIDFLDPLKRAQEAAESEMPSESDNLDKEPFDERAFLQGMVPVVSEKNIPKEIPSWVKKAPKADPDCFDEKDYLHGRIPLIGEGTPDLRPVSRPRKKKPKKPEPEPEPVSREPFDEKAFLAGEISILGGSLNEATPPRQPRKQVEKQYAEWERRPAHNDEDEQPDDNSHDFDERQFLQGNVPVVSGALDSPRIVPFSPKQQPKKTKAPWERFRVDTSDEGESECEEKRYLAGRVSTGVQDLQTTTKHTTDNAANKQHIPTKTFIRLSRSVSRDASENTAETLPASAKPELKVLRRVRGKKPGFDRSRSMSPGTAQRRQRELQLGTSKDVPMDNMTYTGTEIHSKAFARLQSQISRSESEEPPKDSLERLRRNSLTSKPKPAWEECCVDAEKVLEVMQIKEHSPERFFDALESVAKGNEPKVNDISKPAKIVKPAVPASPQTKIPTPAHPTPKQTNTTKPVAPHSQQKNMQKPTPLSPQQKGTPKPVAPAPWKQASTTPQQANTAPQQASTAPQQANTAPQQASTAPQQANTVPQQASTSPQQANPTQQQNKTPASPSTGGIKVISRSISQEPKQQPFQPAQQQPQPAKQQIHIQAQKPQQQKQQPPQQQKQQPPQQQKQQPQQQKQQPPQQQQAEQQPPPQPQQFADMPIIMDGEDQVTDF